MVRPNSYVQPGLAFLHSQTTLFNSHFHTWVHASSIHETHCPMPHPCHWRCPNHTGIFPGLCGSALWTLARLALFLAICSPTSSPLLQWELLETASFDSSLFFSKQDPTTTKESAQSRCLGNTRMGERPGSIHPCASEVLTRAEGWIITVWL